MKVTIIPIVIGAFGTITKGLLKGLEDLKVGGRVETIQTTALLKTARILRRVLETWGDLLSLKLHNNVPCSSWKVANDIWLTEWNYQITTKLERSEKMKPTNTLVSWRLTPSNKWKWKTRSEKNISGELENYWR